MVMPIAAAASGARFTYVKRMRRRSRSTRRTRGRRTRKRRTGGLYMIHWHTLVTVLQLGYY